MQETLIGLSTFHHPDPGEVFQRVVDSIAAEYPGTMAMVTLLEDDRMRYRAVANLHPALRHLDSVAVTRTYCQLALRELKPLLIQDAARELKNLEFPGILLGLTRYLGVPIRNLDGAALGTLCLLDGRSDQALGESDFRFMSLLAMRVSAELHRERMIQAMLDQERRAAEEKQRFITAVIHDLRQPLATARTLLHVAQSGAPPEERHSCLDLLDQRLVAICRMVDELMEYSHVRSGENAWRSERVNLELVLLTQVESFKFEAEALGILVATEIDPSLGSLETDPIRLGHIVHNLLSNALKFTAHAAEGERRVVLRARPIRRSYWELEVQDTGIGMSPSFLRRVFDEGSRAPGTTALEDSIGYPRGKGIGLAIAKALCAAAGAEVRVRSRRGHGTRFTLRFPKRTS